jgi:hypothetical protein
MAGEGEKGAEKGFRVQDRRRFSPETGEPREGKAEEVAPGITRADESGADKTSGKEGGAGEDLPEISFSTFVIGLSTQALMHLGEIPNPLSGQVESALPVAKQMIDIIGILREKTRGNLDQGEEKLMEDVLYDLRMRYVEAVKKK